MNKRIFNTTLRAYQIRQPFKPFLVELASGATLEVRHHEGLVTAGGAAVYIDSQAQDPAAELLGLGGAKAILATVINGEAMSAVAGGLAVNGTLLLIGAVPSMQVSPLRLLEGRQSVKGWYSGSAIDSQDTLAFSLRRQVRSMNEYFPLDRVAEAYDRMASGRARFRVVLTMTG